MVDAYFRWTLCAFPWLSVLGGVAPLLSSTEEGALPAALAGTAVGLNILQAGLAVPLLHHALDGYLGRGAPPRRLLLVSGVLTLTAEAALLALVSVKGLRGEDAPGGAALAFGAALTPFLMAHCLMVSKRAYLVALAGGTALSAGLLAALTGSGLLPVVLTVLLLSAGLWSFVLARPTGWLLAVFRKLESARETATRLAVAEERLRFGRDLHDVMGRNLAVIALKSELAVRLARRGQPAAVAQMVEVQRIAQESQREVREVVRGYRRAELQTELAGARGVLRAAGVDCRIEGGEGTPLPPEVESALGWVVREGTTNVLRHAAEARRCVLRMLSDPDRSVLVLTMENNGVTWTPDAAAPPAGSGLKGLRERLAPLGGTLTAGPAPDGCFRLTVELPLGAVPAERAGHGSPGPAAGVSEEAGRRDG
ncbi:sensor histidine kinase [Streptomyces kronopolitis]|uniref:sensor histidine kinase n=1 Tax=Streptomyces kronopolitis TaxID=1612435 RepID=UPI003447C5DA